MGAGSSGLLAGQDQSTWSIESPATIPNCNSGPRADNRFADASQRIKSRDLRIIDHVQRRRTHKANLVGKSRRNSEPRPPQFSSTYQYVVVGRGVMYPGAKIRKKHKRQVSGENQSGGFREACKSSGTANAMNCVDRENMELSRTISHLAAANQQLAAAHNLTLGHLHWLYNEFRKPSQRPTPTVAESAEKRGKAKAACPKCSNKEHATRSIGKVRTIFKNQASTLKTTNRRLRKLRKLATFDELSRDVETENENTERQEIEIGLRREIEDLNVFKRESQAKNERLTSDLEEQRLLIERLTRDFQDSQGECERKERSLEQVSQKLEKSELECVRLIAELETFQCERTSAEKMAREEAERKQVLALDEATQQIRALELAIQARNQSATKSNEAEDLQASTASAAAATVQNEEFKKELMLKREARQRAIAAISSEMDRLRRELEAEKLAHSETSKLLENFKETTSQAKSASDLENKTETYKTSERVEALRLSDLLKISDEVTSDLWLQLERTDDLRFQLENDSDEHRLRIGSLKRLSEETRASLRVRKQQMNVLKDRLAQILVRLGDRCFLDKSDTIREEVERQIEDIARSRNLCDERSRILAELKDHCFKEIHELKLKLENSRKDNQSLKEELHKTEDKMDAQDADILNLESQLGLAKADCRDLQNQMSLINSLFSQMLLGASSAEMDLDRLTQLLQENHDLISGMAKENGTEAAALPKLLLDIIEQVDGCRARESCQDKKEADDLQEENIAHNLPKVWRVLLELLSCHAAGTSAVSAAESAPDSCYKSVDTPTGPRLVISVSKTYIRLKELILEKKHVEKEMNRMKQLNTHLESKLSEQEKRLSTVSDELSKTWNIVGRMQAQHQQLHTHEKILRYELQQKRKMLQELKQELEYCREKWESARQKNTNTEIEWRSLRREFAARKALATHTDSLNNSAESGFSDEREEESDEDEDAADVGKRVRPINSRRRSRKDGSRAVTPDTESEQPTDTELSESKTPSSSTSGQRTPTPETEAELENSELIEDDSLPTTTVSQNSLISENEVLDPLDKALTNVIQNLIETNESKYTEGSSGSDSEKESIKVNSTLEKVPNDKVLEEERLSSGKVEESVNESIINPNSQIASPAQISVFTIGPILSQTLSVKNVQFSNPLVIGPSTRIPENIAAESNENSSNSLMGKEESCLLKVSELSTDNVDISIDSTSSHETIKKFSDNQAKNSDPSPSAEVCVNERRVNDFPSTQVLEARAARLRSLEEQAEWLVKKVNDTNRRSSALSSRLEELHETYGSTPAAPPMPDVLPTFRLRTELNDRHRQPFANDNSESASQQVHDTEAILNDGAPCDKSFDSEE